MPPIMTPRLCEKLAAMKKSPAESGGDDRQRYLRRKESWDSELVPEVPT